MISIPGMYARPLLFVLLLRGNLEFKSYHKDYEKKSFIYLKDLSQL